MIDEFTKEELKIILCEMNIVIQKQAESYLKISPINVFFELRNKVQSMVDSYCEHDPHGDFHVCVDKCKKCGKAL